MYEPSVPGDGYRVLIDRLWPRGVRKDEVRLDAWLKDIAPSDALRKWFGHDSARFGEFRNRYRRELRSPTAQALLDDLARHAVREGLTLIYCAHDTQHNNAVVIAEEVERRLPSRASRHGSKRTIRVHHFSLANR